MINYDLKKIKAVIFDIDGVLSCQTITLANDGVPMRTVNIQDGYAIQLAVKCGIHVAILSGAHNESLRVRYAGLGLEDIYLAASQKMPVYESFLEKYGLKDEEVMYMGDDIPDYEIMTHVGCPVCPKDAAVEIKEVSCYISDKEGGKGCGRDVIEQLLRAKGLWVMDKRAFGW